MEHHPAHQTHRDPDLNASIQHLDRDLARLDNSIEQLDHTIERSLKSHGFLPTFLRGIIGALGAAIGGAIVLAGLVYLLQHLTGAPIIGDVVTRLLELVQQNK